MAPSTRARAPTEELENQWRFFEGSFLLAKRFHQPPPAPPAGYPASEAIDRAFVISEEELDNSLKIGEHMVLMEEDRKPTQNQGHGASETEKEDPVEPSPPKKLTYRRELSERMGCKNRSQLLQRRDDLFQACARRGLNLTHPWDHWAKDQALWAGEMAPVIEQVAPEMYTLYGWDLPLVFEVVRVLCQDKSSIVRQKERKQAGQSSPARPVAGPIEEGPGRKKDNNKENINDGARSQETEKIQKNLPGNKVVETPNKSQSRDVSISQLLAVIEKHRTLTNPDLKRKTPATAQTKDSELDSEINSRPLKRARKESPKA